MDDTVIIESPVMDGCPEHSRPAEYCTDHSIDVVSNQENRGCKKIDNISPVTDDSRRKKELEAFQTDMKRLRRKYETSRINVQEEIKNVAMTKRNVIKDISRYKKELVSSLEELEKRSIDMVNDRCKEITRKMEAIADKIDQCLCEIDEALTQTETDSDTNSKVRKKKVNILHDNMSKLVTDFDSFEGVSISLDRDIKSFIDKKNGLATVNLPCQTKLMGKIDIRFDSDSETCGISDICSLADGTVVMTDLSNDCIKRLDKSYSKKDFLQLKGGPLGICATRYGELAVTLRENQMVQFLDYTDTSMIATKSFPTNCPCNYICCTDDALFITCEGGVGDTGHGHIRKYDMTGDLLFAIETDEMGQRLFTTPLHITANPDKTKLLVTDMDNKVIIIDKSGKRLNQYKNTFLAGAFGISALPNKSVFVSSVDSHNVQQFDDKCRYVGTVLNQVNGLEHPVCIAYNGSRGQVIVSMDDTDTLLAFDVSFH